jgi:16S rRNA (uracil1498-N3)-methyltransferase
MRRFYAAKENFSSEKILLSLEETRHLRDVLRLRRSDKVQVFDGAGNEFLCEIEAILKSQTELKILEKVEPAAAESELNLTLAVALLKGEKFDLVIQKAVELGVTKFVPLKTKRVDVRLKDEEKKLGRWQKIAIEACKQSGRAKLMSIKPPMDFESFVKNADGTQILFAEQGGDSFSVVKPDKKITAVIGAEGGWEATEIEQARKNGFQIITLGGRILRAETAAIATVAILQYQFGDLH